MLHDLLLLLGFCWGANTCLNLLGYFKKKRSALSRMDSPLDRHSNLPDGQRLFGDSTTLLGIPVALTSAMLIGLALRLPLLSALIAGLCVYAGHAVGSFIKRRLRVPPGGYVPILDHTDSVLVLGVIYSVIGIVSPFNVLPAMLVSAIFQPVLCYCGYVLKLRERPL